MRELRISVAGLMALVALFAVGGSASFTGVAVFTGVVVTFEQNSAQSLPATTGGGAGVLGNEDGGAGTPSGERGTSTHGTPGANGAAAPATGGAIHTTATSSLTIDPRKGAPRKRSKHVTATGRIANNSATGPLTTSAGGGLAIERGAKTSIRNTGIEANQAETGPDTITLVP